MGLLVKLRKNHPSTWSMFLPRAAELYEEGKSLGLPVGKGNYGIMGNPLNERYLQWFQNNIEPINGDNFVFLAPSIDYFLPILQLYPIAMDLATSLWPGNIILSIPVSESLIETQSTLQPFFNAFNKLHGAELPDFLNLIVSDSPQVLALFEILKFEREFPLLAGSSVDLIYGEICVDTLQLTEIVDPSLFTIILDCGKLQKKNFKPNSILTIEGPENFTTTKQGLDYNKVQLFMGEDKHETI